MKTIYKYQLAVVDEQVIPLPCTAEILSVGVQHGNPVLWAVVDPSHEVSDGQKILICGTGNPMPVRGVDEFIGTFQLLDGNFIGHVFTMEVNND